MLIFVFKSDDITELCIRLVDNIAIGIGSCLGSCISLSQLIFQGIKDGPAAVTEDISAAERAPFRRLSSH